MANPSYKIACGLAVSSVILLFWVIGAVGVIGAAGDRIDLVYSAIFFVAIAGSIIARFDAKGMERAMWSTAFTPVAIAVIALSAGLVPEYNSTLEIMGINGLFAMLFGLSAWLFRQAAKSDDKLPVTSNRSSA